MNYLKSSIKVFEVFNWSIWSLQLEYLKSSIKIFVFEVFNWSNQPFHYFYGWLGGRVGCLKMEIRLSQPQLKLKLSWVELRLSLAIVFQRRFVVVVVVWQSWQLPEQKKGLFYFTYFCLDQNPLNKWILNSFRNTSR